jgi:hypothetical protein
MDAKKLLGLLLLAAAGATNGSSNDPCDLTVSLCSPKAVKDAFDSTELVTQSQGTFKIPASVADDIYMRAFDLSKLPPGQGDNPDWIKENLALNRTGTGRWFTFIGGPDLVEKILVAGRYGATQIYRDIGYGSSFSCSPNGYYWLAVFRKSDELQVKHGFYPNLQSWMNHVYGARAPIFTDSVIEELKSQRFTEITGCPVDKKTGAFDVNNDLSRCSDCFKQAYTALNQDSKCATNSLTYSRDTHCPTDAVLASFGQQPDACHTRAYLYAVPTFNEYNTGYGYTANTYNDPLSREYWTDNANLKDLPELELLRVHCPAVPEAAQKLRGVGMRMNSPYVTIY